MFDDGLAFEDGAHLSARMGHDLEGSAFAAPDARDQLAGRMDEATPRVRYRIPGKRIGGDALDVLHGPLRAEADNRFHGDLFCSFI